MQTNTERTNVYMGLASRLTLDAHMYILA